MEANTEKAIFGAGCFWGIEAAFRKERGVVDVACGYAGGTTDSPTYEEVCTGRTGHAEVVEVVYDTAETDFGKMLEVFWKVHDPTQKDRQGPDVGTQYRSAIFCLDESQREAAERSKADLEAAKVYSRPLATEINGAAVFWRAEEYHQRYIERRSIFGAR